MPWQPVVSRFRPQIATKMPGQPAPLLRSASKQGFERRARNNCEKTWFESAGLAVYALG